ncbi:MAG: FG-GAP-like repeat-containing protein [bacterium]
MAILTTYQSVASVWTDYAVRVGLEGVAAAAVLWLLYNLRSRIPVRFLYLCCIAVLVKLCIPAVPLLPSPITAHSWSILTSPPESLPIERPSEVAEQPYTASNISNPAVSQVPKAEEQPAQLQPPSSSAENIRTRPVDILTPLSPPVRIGWKDILFAGVLIGWTVFLARWGRQILRCRSICRQMQPADEPLRRLVKECAERMGLTGELDVRVSQHCVVPVVVGVRRISLLIPSTLLDSHRDLELAILHELAHVKQRDLLLNWIRGMIQIFHWWNPIVWWINRKTSLLQELCCDEMVLGKESSERYRYLGLLMRFAETASNRACLAEGVAISADFRVAKERMTSILERSRAARMNWIWRLGGVAFAVCLFVGFYVESESSAQPSAQPVETEPSRLGYCFDVALSEDGSTLYLAGGPTGTYVLRVLEDKLEFVRTVKPQPGYHRNIKVQGNYAYLADARKGLVVLDISVPESPAYVFEGHMGDGMGLYLAGTYLYLARGDAGLLIYDISNPVSPTLLGRVRTQDSAWDVWVVGKYAYVADLKAGMAVVDVSVPSEPRYVKNVTWTSEDNMAEIIRGSGNLVHIAAGVNGLVTIDISDPENPVIKGMFKSGKEGYGEGLAVDGTTVYLVNGNKPDQSQNGLYVIDASKPSDLKILGMVSFSGWVEGAIYSGKRVFVSNTASGVRMIDVSDPASPKEAFHWQGQPRRSETQATRPRVSPEEAVFAEVTEISGFLSDFSANSFAVEDADKDGDLDILVFGAGEGRDALYLNQGNFRFTEVSEKAGFPNRLTMYAGAWADADNDGLPDIVFGGEGSERLYLEDPSGKFKQATDSKILSAQGWGAWIDFNLDNALDFVTFGTDQRVFLYENKGKGKFKEIAEGTDIGFVSTGFHAICAYDFERDGYGDIFFGQGYIFPDVPHTRPSLWRNYGNGKFMVLPMEAGHAYFNNEIMMPAIADFDRNGTFDMYCPRYGDTSSLALNNGDGTSSWPKVDDPLLSGRHYATGACVGDYNNDSRPDVFLADRETASLYRKNENLSFEDETYASGVDLSTGTTCPLWVDLDGDFDLDFLVIDPQKTLRVYKNQKKQGNALVVIPMTDADGDATDADHGDDRTAVGAIVEVDLDGDGDFSAEGTDTVLLSDISAASAGRSQPRAHFGLGEVETVDVRVRFPDGSIVTNRSVSANQTLTVLDDASGSVPPAPPVPSPTPTPIKPNPTPSGKVKVGATFRNISSQAGIQRDYNTFCVLVEDFDRDGLLDIYLCTNGGGGQNHPNIVFRNNGNLSFSDITENLGLYMPFADVAAAAADFNNDGIPDVITGAKEKTMLYRSKAGGTYEEAANSLGMSRAIGESAVWLDMDNDNDLDLATDTGLYRNDGADGFTDVTAESGLQYREGMRSILTLDYDRDNRMDLLFLFSFSFTNQPPILLLHNEGDCRFSDETRSSRLSVVGTSANFNNGVAADVNHDGYADICIENRSIIRDRSRSREGPRFQCEFKVFLNDKEGHFAEVKGLFPELHDAFGGCWGDYDNDSDADFFVPSRWGHKLYQNWGNLSFAEVAEGASLTAGKNLGRPLWADMDNDGDLDLIAHETCFPGEEQEYLFENLGVKGNYLVVIPLTDSDGDATDGDSTDERTAVGARVELAITDESGEPVTMTRWITAGAGAMSAPVAHFGLGKAKSANIRVTFPDGSMVEAKEIAAGSRIKVRDTGN